MTWREVPGGSKIEKKIIGKVNGDLKGSESRKVPGPVDKFSSLNLKLIFSLKICKISFVHRVTFVSCLSYLLLV